MLGPRRYKKQGFATPLLAAPAFMRRSQLAGTRLRLHTRMIEAERPNGGWSVETSTGAIRAKRIVVVAGAQTRQVMGLFGLDLPILPHPLQVMVTVPQAPLLRHPLPHPGSRHPPLRHTPSGT